MRLVDGPLVEAHPSIRAARYSGCCVGAALPARAWEIGEVSEAANHPPVGLAAVSITEPVLSVHLWYNGFHRGSPLIASRPVKSCQEGGR